MSWGQKCSVLDQDSRIAFHLSFLALKGSFVPASDLMSEIIIYMKPKSEFFCTFETISVSMV